MVVRVKNSKGFKRDWRVLSMTMKLWITAAGTEFLKDKLASKNKNKEAPTEL
jgi:hypothetical protein